MNQDEIGLIADHMGHHLNVHLGIYRQQCNILERSKVARVLVAMENGKLQKSRQELKLDGAVALVGDEAVEDEGKSIISPHNSIVLYMFVANSKHV